MHKLTEREQEFLKECRVRWKENPGMTYVKVVENDISTLIRGDDECK